jgi:hypothetical protein
MIWRTEDNKICYIGKEMVDTEYGIVNDWMRLDMYNFVI